MARKLETKIYNEKGYNKKTNILGKQTNENLISIFKNFQEIEVLKQKEYYEYLKNHIDMKLYAKILAILSAFGDDHSHKSTNSRYYLSPYDLKIIPILTDFTSTNINDQKAAEKLLNGTNLFYKIYIKDKNFQDEYFFMLNKLQKDIATIKKKFEDICKPFGENCESLVDINSLEKKIIFLKKYNKILNKVELANTYFAKNEKFNTKNIQDLNKKKINFRVFNNGKIFVDNLTVSIEIKINFIRKRMY